MILYGSGTVMALLFSSGPGAGRYRLIVNMWLLVSTTSFFSACTNFIEAESSDAISDFKMFVYK